MIRLRHQQPSLWETFFAQEVEELWTRYPDKWGVSSGPKCSEQRRTAILSKAKTTSLNRELRRIENSMLNNAQAHFHSGQACNEACGHILLLLATSR